MALRPARGTPWWIALAWLPPFLLRRRPVLRVGALGLAGAVTAFFRDPERRPAGDGFLAPADGLVRKVELRDGRWFVSTYLALYNVHVTRVPVAARVLTQRHVEGEHKLAFADDAHVNERLEWTLATPHGELEMVEFSGAAARRIMPYVGPGASVVRGERVSLIRFGSRVDLLLPEGVEPAVAEGVRVRAGETVIATVAGSATA
ncbi:phosphatidylserine decarboxylase [Nocardioides zeae]|uniref:Phosphatidylserine decarboxylase n=1 Tax=Nocardioides imazamoxiresistens TaxID=3231893 RepID=A0ABU3PYN3_9ACTN|nr:phosphatidylserine decarboxylase [Nocardioides zeae]MDT9594352.1 phosphatidylserine decarboxylase [Nocardioides zeae]